MTLYLKYRPQKIADLDLQQVSKMLGKMVESKSLPHAFLFSGPRGLGKTSAARILAKAINCPNIKDGEPCNKCASCLAITEGSAVDLIEVDAASNRGIDEIRQLRDSIQLTPLNSKFKVYIVDEVHMLTTEAANALLKTLEEPPAHAIFVLCTTDPQKLPETVISRCTRINFSLPTQEELVSALEKVVKGEKIKSDKKSLAMIAEAARGSFRDGIKILEQIWLTKGELSPESVAQTLGLLQSADPATFIEFWKQGQVDQALAFIESLVENGVNLRTFIERTLEVLRQELLATKSHQTIVMIEKLDLAYERIKTAAVAQLPLEVLVVENFMPQTTTKAAAPVAPAPVTVVAPDEEEETPTTSNLEKGSKGKYTVTDMVAKWSDILKAVKPKNHSVEALLRSTAPVDFDGQDLLLEVFYKFHKDKLETDKCRHIVEETIGDIFNVQHVRLKLKLGPRQKKEEVTAMVEDDIVKAAAEIFKVEAV